MSKYIKIYFKKLFKILICSVLITFVIVAVLLGLGLIFSITRDISLGYALLQLFSGVICIVSAMRIIPVIIGYVDL